MESLSHTCNIMRESVFAENHKLTYYTVFINNSKKVITESVLTEQNRTLLTLRWYINLGQDDRFLKIKIAAWHIFKTYRDTCMSVYRDTRIPRTIPNPSKKLAT